MEFGHVTRLPQARFAGQKIYCYVCVTKIASLRLAFLLGRTRYACATSDWQNHPHGRAFAQLTFRFDKTAMELCDVFDDGKAEAGAAIFAAARLIRSIKPFEDARQIFFADTDTIIADAQREFPIPLFNSQPNLPAFRRI